MQAGAADFIEKPFDDDILLASLRRTLDASDAGQNPPPDTRAANELISRLTPREWQVLQQLVAGRSNKLAAFELSISSRTIEIHRARIMDKLNARSLSDLVRMALAARVPPIAQH
jgi:two-component system response regulator FixJ